MDSLVKMKPSSRIYSLVERTIALVAKPLGIPKALPANSSDNLSDNGVHSLPAEARTAFRTSSRPGASLLRRLRAHSHNCAGLLTQYDVTASSNHFSRSDSQFHHVNPFRSQLPPTRTPTYASAACANHFIMFVTKVRNCSDTRIHYVVCTYSYVSRMHLR